MELSLASAASPASSSAAELPARVGVAARGLYHQGFALHAGKDYEGYLALKARAPTTVHVRLEDWGSDPAGLQGATPLFAHLPPPHLQLRRASPGFVRVLGLGN